jgi:hypothetical protein
VKAARKIIGLTGTVITVAGLGLPLLQAPYVGYFYFYLSEKPGEGVLLGMAVLVGGGFLLLGNRAWPGALAGLAVLVSLIRTVTNPELAYLTYVKEGWLPTGIELVHPGWAFGCLVLAVGALALISPLLLVLPARRYAARVTPARTTFRSISKTLAK